MDAPQISTLKEDLSPPPNQNAASHFYKLKIRLSLPEQAAPSTGKERASGGKESSLEMITAVSSLAGSSLLKRQAGESEEDEEDEDDKEQDQLSNDDHLLATSNHFVSNRYSCPWFCEVTWNMHGEQRRSKEGQGTKGCSIVFTGEEA